MITLDGNSSSSHKISAGKDELQNNKETLYFDNLPLRYEITNAIYPVGSVYLSLNAANPQIIFGGAWEELTGKYIKLGGSGEQTNTCATACHVTVATYGLNPCPTNCNKLVSNSDIYNGGASCSGAYNNNGYYIPNVDSHTAIEGYCCVWNTYSRLCDYCYNTCYSGYTSCGQGGQESITGYGEYRCGAGERGCSGSNIDTGYYLCLNGCVGCVSCHSNTYYTCHSCNSSCHSCNSGCHSCYSNCHGTVGDSFDIIKVHMWKRVG